MRLVYGAFSIAYDGRGHTFRETAERLLIMKEDGSVAIHNDKGFKPVNYMIPPVELSISGDTWTFSSTKEKIVLEFDRIYSDSNLLMEVDDAKVIREGTEDHLQLWLSENLHRIAPQLRFLEREFETGEGPVDLLAVNHLGQKVLIEVKRVAAGTAVAQINRYLASYREQDPNAKGMIMAVDYSKRCLELAKKHDIECIVVPKPIYPHGLYFEDEGKRLISC